MTNITKLEIARQMAQRSGAPLHDARRYTEDFFNIIKDAITNGNDVTIRTFGTLKIIKRKQKTARNINTATTITVPARKTVKFIPSKQLTIK